MYPCRIWVLLVGFLLWNQHVLRSEETDFSIAIVGARQEQEHYFKDAQAKLDKGLAVIKIPAESKSKDLEEDAPTRNCFYVVIRNISQRTIRLDATMSEWFNCMKFQVISENGKLFSIHRPLSQAWFANADESWVFQPDGVRILAVDFTTGSWEGFPSAEELPRNHPFKIQALFKLHPFGLAEQSCKSPIVDAGEGNY